MLVSVVIPTKNSEKTIVKCLESILKNRGGYEIILVDDSGDRTREVASKYPVKVLYAPGKNISESRNMGIEVSRGDIIAFTDDDCVVPEDWLDRALNFLKGSKVGAVGGPNLTPPNSVFSEKVAGLVLGSWFGSGASYHRYSIADEGAEFREVDETKLITCNLFFNRDALKQVGLFDPKQFPCEENELLHRMKQRGWKLLYVPSLHVWHKRRPLFTSFLKQIKWYGFGRALLLKKAPRSMNPVHLVPSLFLLGVVCGAALAAFSGFFRLLYGLALTIYFTVNFIASLQLTSRENLRFRHVPLLVFTFLATHVAYGAGFLLGLFKR